MKTNPLISIITPAYNTSATISETIRSVVTQTYSLWEMIIINDASTDDTQAIVSAAIEKDSRIKLISLTRNAGVAAARNTGLQAAEGDYIAFIDGDDLWAPEKLDHQLRFMQENGYGITYTMYRTFAMKDRCNGRITNVPDTMTYQSVFRNTSIACLTVMVNRRIVGEFRFPPLTHTEDQCAWQEIMKRGYAAYALQEVLAYYRVSKHSMTGRRFKSAQLQWQTYRRHFRLSLLKSAYYFACYFVNALKKHYGY